MRMIIVAWGVWLLLAGVAQARIDCMLIETPFDLGRIGAHDQNARFSAMIEMSCRNGGNADQTALIVLDIDAASRTGEREKAAMTSRSGGRIPLTVRDSRFADPRLAPEALCLPVQLQAGATGTYILPVAIMMRLSATRSGHYTATVPYTITVQENGRDPRCGPRVR